MNATELIGHIRCASVVAIHVYGSWVSLHISNTNFNHNRALSLEPDILMLKLLYKIYCVQIKFNMHTLRLKLIAGVGFTQVIPITSI